MIRSKDTQDGGAGHCVLGGGRGESERFSLSGPTDSRLTPWKSLCWPSAPGTWLLPLMPEILRPGRHLGQVDVDGGSTPRTPDCAAHSPKRRCLSGDCFLLPKGGCSANLASPTSPTSFINPTSEPASPAPPAPPTSPAPPASPASPAPPA